MELDTASYDNYIADLFAPQDAALTETLVEMEREGVRSINVSPVEGKLLQVLALLIGARRILEIGTLGGYSGIHLARALPDGGKLITLEIDPHHARVARRNFERAGVGEKVEICVGPATETLPQIAARNEPLFDVIFIDADKEGYPEYLRLSLPLLRNGGLIMGDNTLRGALQPENDGAQHYNADAAQNGELTSILIPVLRQRGLDGLTVSVKRCAA